MLAAFKSKDDELHRQVREAARSPRNIGEGCGRFKHRDFAKFVRIAKASEGECFEHLLEAHDEGYLSNNELRELEHLTKQ